MSTSQEKEGVLSVMYKTGVTCGLKGIPMMAGCLMAFFNVPKGKAITLAKVIEFSSIVRKLKVDSHENVARLLQVVLDSQHRFNNLIYLTDDIARTPYECNALVRNLYSALHEAGYSFPYHDVKTDVMVMAKAFDVRYTADTKVKKVTVAKKGDATPEDSDFQILSPGPLHSKEQAVH